MVVLFISYPNLTTGRVSSAYRLRSFVRPNLRRTRSFVTKPFTNFTWQVYSSTTYSSLDETGQEIRHRDSVKHPEKKLNIILVQISDCLTMSKETKQSILPMMRSLKSVGLTCWCLSGTMRG